MHIRARFIRLNLVFTNFDFKKYQSSFLVQSLPRIDINVFYKVPKYRKVSPTYHSLKHIFFSSGKLKRLKLAIAKVFWKSESSCVANFKYKFIKHECYLLPGDNKCCLGIKCIIFTVTGN